VSANPTVSDLWALAFPPQTFLAGGKDGLTRPVEWVVRLRPSFPLFAELGEGYLAIANPRVARELDPRFTLDYLMHELARLRAAGLVMNELVLPEQAALADALALPLFCVPPETDLHAIEREALRALVDRQGQMVRREAEARDRYQQIFAEGGIPAVLHNLASAVGGAAEVRDSDGTLVAQMESSAMAHPLAFEESVFPIVIGGKALGRLVVKAPKDVQPLWIGLLARPAADVCGLEMFRQAMRQEAEAEFGADLVEQILAASLEEPDLAARLRRLGYDPSEGRRHIVLAVGAKNAKKACAFAEALARDLAWASARGGSTMVTLPYREGALCFLSFEASVPERRARGWFHQALSGMGKMPCDLGVSQAVESLSALREAIEQATAALALGQRANLPSPYYYEDLGLYRLLWSLHGRAELRRFYEEILGALVAYDRAHAADLVLTLEVFFRENANASQTARALNVHRNTLAYRLQRIAEITGADLDDPEVRLAFQLALKVRKLAE